MTNDVKIGVNSKTKNCHTEKVRQIFHFFVIEFGKVNLMAILIRLSIQLILQAKDNVSWQGQNGDVDSLSSKDAESFESTVDMATMSLTHDLDSFDAELMLDIDPNNVSFPQSVILRIWRMLTNLLYYVVDPFQSYRPLLNYSRPEGVCAVMVLYASFCRLRAWSYKKHTFTYGSRAQKSHSLSQHFLKPCAARLVD